jgi:hypothetical protein
MDMEQAKMATKKVATERPLIQIDDEVREMTDEEYAEYLKISSDIPPSPEA